MRKITYLILLFVIIACKSQQVDSNMWKNSKSDISVTDNSPISFKQYVLQEDQFSSKLRLTGNQKAEGVVLSIPDPEGKLSEFIIWKSTVANQELVNKYPNLQTYQGVSKQSDAIKIRIENSKAGIQALIFGGKTTWYITPEENLADTYLIYYKKDLPTGSKSFWSDKVIKEN